MCVVFLLFFHLFFISFSKFKVCRLITCSPPFLVVCPSSWTFNVTIFIDHKFQDFTSIHLKSQIHEYLRLCVVFGYFRKKHHLLVLLSFNFYLFSTGKLIILIFKSKKESSSPTTNAWKLQRLKANPIAKEFLV